VLCLQRAKGAIRYEAPTSAIGVIVAGNFTNV
jgi:hypothetical protein